MFKKVKCICIFYNKNVILLQNSNFNYRQFIQIQEEEHHHQSHCSYRINVAILVTILQLYSYAYNYISASVKSFWLQVTENRKPGVFWKPWQKCGWASGSWQVTERSGSTVHPCQFPPLWLCRSDFISLRSSLHFSIYWLIAAPQLLNIPANILATHGLADSLRPNSKSCSWFTQF